MKRTILTVFSLLLTTAAFAADTQRYLVATNAAATGARGRITAGVKQMMGDDFETRAAVVPFASFAGFAASLTESELATLRQSPSVRWVEPVVERHALVQDRHPLRQTVPFGISTIFAAPAQSATPKGIVNVAVVDTGIDYRHPDLQKAYAGGWNIYTNTADPLDDDGHGTHVSGTIGATDNGFGVVGVAPNVRIWSVKVLDAQGNGTTEGVLKGLDWVMAQKTALGGNWVVNLSLGSTIDSEGEREAFQLVADRGILIVAAAGNRSTSTTPAPVSFPAAYPSVVAVAAVTFDGKHAFFSSQGPELDLSAPGVDILSTIPTGVRDVAYLADGNSATFSTAVTGSKRGVVSGEFVYCGTGKVGDYPASVAGRIALIQRGDSISFADKTRRAKEAGAIAVAIFDNVAVPTNNAWTLFSDETDREYDWPVTVRLPLEIGQALVAAGSHPVTIAYTKDEYGESSGTSMACPHVVGSAALLWTLAPDATAQQIVSALTTTATDLGAPGPDTEYGAGLINLNAAAHFIAPSSFTGITTGRPIGQRGRH
jgi:serine protease